MGSPGLGKPSNLLAGQPTCRPAGRPAGPFTCPPFVLPGLRSRPSLPASESPPPSPARPSPRFPSSPHRLPAFEAHVRGAPSNAAVARRAPHANIEVAVSAVRWRQMCWCRRSQRKCGRRPRFWPRALLGMLAAAAGTLEAFGGTFKRNSIVKYKNNRQKQNSLIKYSKQQP